MADDQITVGVAADVSDFAAGMARAAFADLAALAPGGVHPTGWIEGRRQPVWRRITIILASENRRLAVWIVRTLWSFFGRPAFAGPCHRHSALLTLR